MFSQMQQALWDSKTSIEDYLVGMLRFIQKEKENYWILGSDNGDPNLMSKTLQFSYDHATALMKDKLINLDPETEKMLVRFLIHGNAGILSGWIRDGMKLEPEAVVTAMMTLCAAVANTI